MIKLHGMKNININVNTHQLIACYIVAKHFYLVYIFFLLAQICIAVLYDLLLNSQKLHHTRAAGFG
jgi:hypothetical protein